jgi:hypothetical protein
MSEAVMSIVEPGITGRRSSKGAARKARPHKARAPPDEFPLTMSVPEAGKKYFGLSRNGSYDAAARGEIPTIPIGRLLRVPVRAMEAMLDSVASGSNEEPSSR